MAVRPSAKIAAIFLAALVLIGCSAIDSGVITKKTYSEAYDYPVSYCQIYNGKGQCTIWGQRWEHVPERFKFDIQNDNEDTGWVYVSESEYEQYKIGDYYGKKE